LSMVPKKKNGGEKSGDESEGWGGSSEHIIHSMVLECSGIVVNVLPLDPRVAVQTRPRWWIRSTPSFGWEVKPEVSCRKTSWHVKDPLRYFRYWYAKFSLLYPFLLLASRWLYWLDCQSSLVDESGVFPSQHHHHGSPHSHIT
jgi:hypothetical protein